MWVRKISEALFSLLYCSSLQYSLFFRCHFFAIVCWWLEQTTTTATVAATTKHQQWYTPVATAEAAAQLSKSLGCCGRSCSLQQRAELAIKLQQANERKAKQTNAKKASLYLQQFNNYTYSILTLNLKYILVVCLCVMSSRGRLFDCCSRQLASLLCAVQWWCDGWMVGCWLLVWLWCVDAYVCSFVFVLFIRS